MDESESERGEPVRDYVPPWWERGPHGRANRAFDRSPTRVLAFYAVMGLLGIAIIVQAIVEPSSLHRHRAVGARVGSVVMLPIIVVYAPRAWRARQAKGRRRD